LLDKTHVGEIRFKSPLCDPKVVFTTVAHVQANAAVLLRVSSNTVAVVVVVLYSVSFQIENDSMATPMKAAAVAEAEAAQLISMVKSSQKLYLDNRLTQLLFATGIEGGIQDLQVLEYQPLVTYRLIYHHLIPLIIIEY